MALPDDLEDHWHDFRRSLARRGRSAATIDVYRQNFEQFWTWALAAGIDPDPRLVDASVINKWTDHLLTTPAVRNGRPLVTRDPNTGNETARPITATTRRIRHANLRPFFSWYAREYETANPFDRADPPRDAVDGPVPIVHIDDVRRLLGTCAGKEFVNRRDNAIIRVLFDLGPRLGELVHLDVDDFDRRRDRLTLRGKTGTRIVPMSASTAEGLSRYLRARKDHPQAKRPALWLASKGALGESGVAQLLRRRCAAAGIEPINPHRFRHTWAHLQKSNGLSEGDLMYAAGWKSTAMAHRYGRSAAAERAQDAMRKIGLGDLL